MSLAITDEMLASAGASVVLGKIEDSGDGYVPAPEERLTCEFLLRERLVRRTVDHQDADEGYAARWRYFTREDA